MEKLVKYEKSVRLVLGALLILLIPSFWRMLKPGIYSMQDFHFFRVYEYHKCIIDLQIPCRWSPDVAFEYGQPLFNFYGQLPYLYGEIFLFLGASVIDTTKILFASSLILSALAMFLLAKQMWKNNLAALLSAVIYTYAPYRAVDVFVRGALSECFAFIFFPLVMYFFNDYVEKRKKVSLLFIILSLSGLILTHNLSVLMLAFFMIPWAIYYLTREKAWKLVPNFLIVFIFTFGLTASYLLPVISESKLVTIEETTKGYFYYQIHFTTLKQLLIERFWGYGASTWSNYDDLSLSVGHIQWILPTLIAIYLVYKKLFKKYLNFFVLFILGWVMLWLTHNKSIIVWEILPVMSYLQFPWRFLSLAVFSFSLASGCLILLIPKEKIKYILVGLITFIVISLNISFFFEDLWYSINDKQLFSGYRYNQIISSSIHDYWPVYAEKTPVKKAETHPIYLEGTGEGKLVFKNSKKVEYLVTVASESAEISFPVVYFPGWEGFINSQLVFIYPKGELGLISAKFRSGENKFELFFTNTPVRTIGNSISLVTIVVIIILIGFFLKIEKTKNEN